MYFYSIMHCFIDSFVLSIENNSRKRKDISHNNTRQDTKQLKLNSSNESLNYNSHKQDDNKRKTRNSRKRKGISHDNNSHKQIAHEISDHKIEEIEFSHDVAVTIVLDSGILINMTSNLCR